jgi:hypothetical protein
MHGDKDTYRLAFHLAGSLDQFQQVGWSGAVPVAGGWWLVLPVAVLG